MNSRSNRIFVIHFPNILMTNLFDSFIIPSIVTYASQTTSKHIDRQTRHSGDTKDNRVGASNTPSHNHDECEEDSRGEEMKKNIECGEETVD